MLDAGRAPERIEDLTVFASQLSEEEARMLGSLLNRLQQSACSTSC